MQSSELIAQQIKYFRKDKLRITAKELGQALEPPVSDKTISSWERGRTRPNHEFLIQLSRIFEVPVTTFYPEEVSADYFNDSSPSYSNVPLYGSIAAGTPLTIIPVEDTFPVPIEVHKRYPDGFLLKVKGESMNKVLPNGSYALIDPTCSEIKNDAAYALCVAGNDATIKRVRKLANGVALSPDSTDPTFKTTVLDFEESNPDEISIIGKVVWMMLPFDWEF